MNTRKTIKVIIGVVVIGTAVGYFLYEAIESSWAYYYSVDEFVESPFCEMPQNDDSKVSNVDNNRIIRLAGRVKGGSVTRDAENMRLDFKLAGQRNSVAVRYYGAVPKNFESGKEVVVEGKVDIDGVFNASKILTRCESKYKVRLKDTRFKTPD